MSDIHHEFTDAESASFLHAEDRSTRKEFAGSNSKSGRSGTRFRSTISCYLPYILLVVCVFEALGIWLVSSKQVLERHLIPSQDLLVSKKIIVFNPDESYDDDPFGPDGIESAWNKLIPTGKGHVRVQNPAAWELSGGFPLEDEAAPGVEEYTISLYHQLHCLAAIKAKMSRLQAWYKGENDKEYLTFAIGDQQVADNHIYHCFDYIRQAIMCNADTTLEKARVVDGRIVRGVDGWGVAHECRDYDSIFAFAEARRSGNVTGI
ncbi:hypothetical protein CONLIGDRAFT_679656 [Coniochaeta ligniaria NRRL 30616]|uniref:Uncharacterized protein n=1 Tax=Coniochaeta ligniaria NRRL 30616 TaxID=1408157 RepID=A0A1J7ITA4_9PEZI|nr:hypothetical protein CONLIGDRAFT_679656 [Coniochaeta ligniaria NRRL 30616]